VFHLVQTGDGHAERRGDSIDECLRMSGLGGENRLGQRLSLYRQLLACVSRVFSILGRGSPGD